MLYIVVFEFSYTFTLATWFLENKSHGCESWLDKMAEGSWTYKAQRIKPLLLYVWRVWHTL